MIPTVVVGYGLAGRAFHCPLIRRQPELKLYGIVARDPVLRGVAVAEWGDEVRGFASLEQALEDPAVRLVVIATPHATHADLAVRALEASRHCVVDKVMALSAGDSDRMLAARDRSGCMLSVFHNRRWDWDYLTVKQVLAQQRLGRPLLFESAVCRLAAPQGWRGRLAEAGSILYDWGAHLVDQALQLELGPCRRVTSWLMPAPWEGVDTGGHGRIMLEFDGVLFQVETSRTCRIDRPRWWIVGTDGGFVKYGIDPQEEALRAGNIDRAQEPPGHEGVLRLAGGRNGDAIESRVSTVRGHWDAYYANVADFLLGRAPLAVTAEQAREVVRLLEAASQSSREHKIIEGHWGEG
jgi:scyllo-inositol 2-dehydrogenase (NADP+)